MADIQRQYYYKNVEAAYKRFNEVCASMLPLAEDMGMTQTEDLKMWTQFQGFSWSKHPSVEHLGLTESELTDDQKEEIALSNKVEFDAAIKELNEMSDLWESVTKKSDIVEQATIDMTDMVLDSIKNSLMYDYHGELNGEYDAPPHYVDG